MGLAASQARFLGITARKSNIEYEGQQVNQQRTALAEEVNALYNQLLSLKLPIAPATTDFYQSNYSFELSNTEGLDGNYIVKSYYKNDDDSYYLNTERTYTKNVASGTLLQNSSITKQLANEEDGTEEAYVLNTPEGNYILNKLTEESSKSMISLINNTYGADTVKDKYLYSYQDSNGETHYIPASQVKVTSETDKINSYISTQKEITETKIFKNAQVTFDSNGRFSSLYAVDDSGTAIFGDTEVNTARTYDTEGYDAALRDYTMSKDEYDKKVEDLNAQTKSLQQEDKILELRLNQIDTEQNELQTELEAVKAVLDKNIENTFNTFS